MTLINSEIDTLAILAKTDDAAKEQLFMKLEPTISKFIRSFGLYVPGMDRDDMKQVGYLGFLEALNRYDPTRGNFKQSVYVWAKTHIMNELNKTKQSKRRAHFESHSLNTAVTDKNEQMTFMDMLTASPHMFKSPEERLYHMELLEKVKAHYDKMRPKSKEIIRLTIFEGHSYQETADMLGLKGKKNVDNVVSKFRLNVRRIKEEYEREDETSEMATG